MKRPQFSLLLMLLVVALSAVIIAWRQAASKLNRLNTVPQQTNIETELQLMEQAKAGLDEQGLKNWGTYFDIRIDSTRKKLEELKKQ